MTAAPAADPAVEEVARAAVTAGLGAAARPSRLELVQAGASHLVLLVTTARPERRLVLKIAGPEAKPLIDHERTAAATALAGAAGVPVPAVLAADSSGRVAGRQYLLQEHVDGIEWRLLRPRLDPGRAEAAQHQVADAVRALHSVRFPAAAPSGSFGELDGTGRPAGEPLVAALRRRAALRVADPGQRGLFGVLLDRDAALFDGVGPATLCHDDLHHGNLLFRPEGGGWRLAAVLDWDKAWAGPAESDLARLAFWDDMTAPGDADPDADRARRALLFQLLWCFEYAAGTPRHAADTAALLRRLDAPPG